jgi:hypothetical protein
VGVSVLSKGVAQDNGQRMRVGRRRAGSLVPRHLTFVAGAVLVMGIAIVGVSASAFAAPTITITPSTGLTGGATVTITGTGFANNSPGNVLECNSDAKQPTVALPAPISTAVSVGCNAPSLSALVATKADGTLSATFKVIQGTVGPPCGPQPALVTCPATDSAGNSATADAALYPCPPTPAQQAAGDTCTLTYGDQANDTGMGTISFAGSGPPPTTATTAAVAPTTTRAPAATTTLAPATAGSSVTTSPAAASATPAPTALATTGPGSGVGWLGAIGGVLILFGLLLLMVMDAPRRALAGFVVPLRERKMKAPRDDAPSHPLRPGYPVRPHRADVMARWAEHVDHVGRKVGDQVMTAPSVARGVAHKMASASTRTATWFLGR